MTHTPGPWEAVKSIHGYWFIEHEQGEEKYTLTPLQCKMPDARLIATAPELLSALKLCLYTFKEMLSDGKLHYMGTKYVLEEAINAINKAEGKPCNLPYKDIATK